MSISNDKGSLWVGLNIRKRELSVKPENNETKLRLDMSEDKSSWATSIVGKSAMGRE